MHPTSKPPASLGKKIFRATALIIVANLLFKLAGLIQAKVMGHCLLPGDFDVLYSFVFQNCIYGLFLIGEESLAPAFMPVFLEELGDGDDRKGWRFANSVLTLQAVILVGTVALLMLFPDWMVRLWTDWAPDSDRFRLGCVGVRWLAPALIGLSLGTTTYVILNAYQRFFLAAFGDAVWKFTVVAALLVGVVFLRGDARILLMAGLVVGALLKVGTHLVGLRDKVRFFRPSFDWGSPAMKRLYRLMLPLIAGILFAKLRDLFNNVTVLSRLESTGLMRANSVGRMLQGAIHTLVPLTLSTAVFPFFCKLVDNNDTVKFAETLTRMGRFLLAVFLPFVTVLAVLAFPLTHFIFHGGQFDAEAVEIASLSTALYVLVIPASAVEALAMRGFFANRRMVAMTVVGIVFSSLSMLVSWTGMQLDLAAGGIETALPWAVRACDALHLRGFGEGWITLAAIAGGFSITRVFKCVALVAMLRSSAPVFPPRATAWFLVRVLAVAVASGVAAWAASRCAALLPIDPAQLDGRVEDMARLLLGGGAGALAALAGLWLLRVREPFEIVPLVLSRRNRPTAPSPGTED